MNTYNAVATPETTSTTAVIADGYGKGKLRDGKKFYRARFVVMGAERYSRRIAKTATTALVYGRMVLARLGRLQKVANA